MTIRYETLTSDAINPAFDLATAVFVNHSTLHKTLGIELSEYRAYLRPSFNAMVDEDLSVVALDEEKVIGCLITTDFANSIAAPETVPMPFAPIAAITRQLCQGYAASERITLGDTVMVDMAAVDPDHTGRGIYKKLRRKAQDVARAAGYKHIVTELSSPATQHFVLNVLGHRSLGEVQFKNFRHGDDYPFASITQPPSLILAQGDL